MCPPFPPLCPPAPTLNFKNIVPNFSKLIPWRAEGEIPILAASPLLCLDSLPSNIQVCPDFVFLLFCISIRHKWFWKSGNLCWSSYVVMVGATKDLSKWKKEKENWERGRGGGRGRDGKEGMNKSSRIRNRRKTEPEKIPWTEKLVIPQNIISLLLKEIKRWVAQICNSTLPQEYYWENMQKCKFIPKKQPISGYPPACHTALQPTIENGCDHCCPPTASSRYSSM